MVAKQNETCDICLLCLVQASSMGEGGGASGAGAGQSASELLVSISEVVTGSERTVTKDVSALGESCHLFAIPTVGIAGFYQRDCVRCREGRRQGPACCGHVFREPLFKSFFGRNSG